MKYLKNDQKGGNGLLIAIIVVLVLIVLVLAAMLLWPRTEAEGQNPAPQTTAQQADTALEQTQGQEQPQEQTEEQTEQTEEPGVPVALETIVLTVPADVKDQISARQTALKDGQQVQFVTDLDGEELLLFQVTVNQSGAEGHRLGVLKDATAGELVVTIHVYEYLSGDWTPEQYERLNTLQSRVNDIITQFYEDPRFEPGS